MEIVGYIVEIVVVCWIVYLSVRIQDIKSILEYQSKPKMIVPKELNNERKREDDHSRNNDNSDVPVSIVSEDSAYVSINLGFPIVDHISSEVKDLLDQRKKEVCEYLDYPTLCCQLAEEASELSQAALKLYRISTIKNPPSDDLDTIIKNLIEEYTDVVHVAEFMDIYCNIPGMVKKSNRWVSRLEAAQCQDQNGSKKPNSETD